MNFLMLAGLMAFSIELIVGSIVYFSENRPFINTIFSLSRLVQAFMVFAFFLPFQAHNTEEARFWIRFGGAWPLIIAFLFHFVLLYTKSKWLRVKYFIPAIYLPLLACAVIQVSDVSGIVVVKQSWGYFTNGVQHYPALALLTGTYSGMMANLCFFVILFHYFKIPQGREKKQSFVLLWALGIPNLCSILSQTPLHILLGLPESSSWMAPAIISQSILVAIAITRYKLFTLTPISAAEVILTSIGDAVIAMDNTGKVNFMNTSAETLTGWTTLEARQAGIGRVFRIINEQTRQPVPSPVDQVLRTGKVAELAPNTLLLAKDGREVPIDDSAAPIKDKNNEIQGVVLIMRDISERKQTEEERQLASLSINRIFETISSIIICVNQENKITQWNSAAAEAFGISIKAALGQSFKDCPIPWEWNETLKNLPKILTRDRTLKYDRITYHHPDGKEALLNLTITPVRFHEHSISEFLLVGNDITDYLHLQMQVLQSQKMEAIGQLAAGIAHEINTPIQYISDNTRFFQEAANDLVGFVEQCGFMLNNHSKGEAATEEILDALNKAVQALDFDYLLQEIPKALSQSMEGLNRVSKIVQAMKGFAHPDMNHEKSPVNLNQNIENTVTISKNEWKYVAEMVLNLDPDLPLVHCLAGEINQVILNIVVNAAQAIGEIVEKNSEEKGRITISTRQTGEWVEIRIHNTGPEIPEKIKNRIFEPFFTTKPVGKGTGQGLAIARSVVVDKHNGSMILESEPGQGTAFIIKIPFAEKTGSPGAGHG